MRRPTKSGVIGLVANALGRDYTSDNTDLAEMHFAVRADRPGHLTTDDQTAGGGSFPLMAADYVTNPDLAANPQLWVYGAPRADRRRATDQALRAPWKPSARTPVILSKAFIADGAFVAGLTGHDHLVDMVAEALLHPRRLLYLGRRRCALDSPPMYDRLATAEWVDTVPLLPNATTDHPRYWRETPPAPGTVGSCEQPGTAFGENRVIHFVSGVVVPPGPEAPC
jgi:CRISPR system Cascade subunit CasD